MYVCVCSGVTESQIREAVANGARNLGDLRTATGCASTCCQCVSAAVELLNDDGPSANGEDGFPGFAQPA